MIRVLVVDDHPVMRQGMAMLLEAEHDLEVVALAVDGIDAVEQAVRQLPDVVLMDISMPRSDGVAAIRALRRKVPHVRVLAFTGQHQASVVRRVLAAGADGYLLKGSRAEEVLAALRQVACGGHPLSPMAERALTH